MGKRLAEKQMRNHEVKLPTSKTNLPVYTLAQHHKAAAATNSQHGSGESMSGFINLERPCLSPGFDSINFFLF